MTAAWATNAAPRFQRPGTKPRPRPPSKLPAMSPRHIKQLAGAIADRPSDEPLIRKYCMQFVERAFRRPLSDEQQKFYVQRQFEAAPDTLTGSEARRVARAQIASVSCIARSMGAAADPYDVAARMSFGMWDSAPDRELIESRRARQTRDSRTDRRHNSNACCPTCGRRPSCVSFLLSLAEDIAAARPLERPQDVSRVHIARSRPTCEHRSKFRSTKCSRVDSADYRQLLLSDAVWLNGRLAKVYGVPICRLTRRSKSRF